MSLGLYIHFPFCLSKCYYCSFNSIPYNHELASSYLDAIKKEIVVRAAEDNLKHRSLSTIFFGGGTPSLISSEDLNEIIDICKEEFDVIDDAEISIEANPDTLTRQKAEDLRSSGINRISIGMQSLSNKYLKIIGRRHDADSCSRVISLCRSAGFGNINIDLIYGLPYQTLEDWIETLEKAISFNTDHISVYGLTIEEGTRFYQLVKEGEIEPPSEDLQIEIYMDTLDRLKKAGYEHYEISNFAKQGKRCRHNLFYWDREEYIGIGAGAHSYIGNKKLSNTVNIESYIAQMRSGVAENRSELVNIDDQLLDVLIFGIRKIEGIDLDDLRRRFGIDPYPKFRSAIDRLISDELITISGNCIRLTTNGLLFADQVAVELLL